MTVAFSARALERLGALVEVAGETASALLPPDLASRLSLPEDVTLGAEHTPCSFGSPLLELLVEDVRATTPFSAGHTSLLSPKESVVRALADAFVIRNGVAATVEVGVVTATYLVTGFAWTVEADERAEGLAVGAVALADGGLPAVAMHLDPELWRQDPSDPPPMDPVVAGAWVARLAPLVCGPPTARALTATAGRHAREYARIADYYGQLTVEARRPRGKIDRAAIDAKVAHLLAERDGRFADLLHRYGARVTVRPAGVLALSMRVGSARLQLRRRKGERTVTLRLPPGARVFDRFPCEGCAAWIEGPPALCDDRLHLLCAACVPEATGRPRCPTCRPA